MKLLPILLLLFTSGCCCCPPLAKQRQRARAELEMTRAELEEVEQAKMQLLTGKGLEGDALTWEQREAMIADLDEVIEDHKQRVQFLEHEVSGPHIGDWVGSLIGD